MSLTAKASRQSFAVAFQKNAVAILVFKGCWGSGQGYKSDLVQKVLRATRCELYASLKAVVVQSGLALFLAEDGRMLC